MDRAKKEMNVKGKEKQKGEQQVGASQASHKVSDLPSLEQPNFKQLELKALRKKLLHYISQNAALESTCTQQMDQLKELDSLRIEIDDLKCENNLLLTHLEDKQNHIQALERGTVNQDETIEKLSNQISQFESKCDQEKRAVVQIVKDALEDHFHKKIVSLKAQLEYAYSEVDNIKFQYAKMYDIYVQQENLLKRRDMLHVQLLLKEISEDKLACEKEQLAKEALIEKVLAEFKKLQQQNVKGTKILALKRDDYKSEPSSSHELSEYEHQQHLAASLMNKFERACSLPGQPSHQEELKDAVESFYLEMLQEYVTSKAESAQKESVCDKEVVDNRRFMVGSVEVGTWDSHLVEDSDKEIKQEGEDNIRQKKHEEDDGLDNDGNN